MAFRIGLQQPNRFAGIVSMNGPLPDGQSPMAHWERCRSMPVFWSHHVDPAEPDNAINMCRHFQSLYAAGFLNLTAREYPTLQYLEQLAPSAVNRWIMEQIQSSIL